LGLHNRFGIPGITGMMSVGKAMFLWTTMYPLESMWRPRSQYIPVANKYMAPPGALYDLSKYLPWCTRFDITNNP